MSWSLKHIQEMQNSGKIAGYSIQGTKGYSASNREPIPRKKPKGVIWLELNLAYWANEKSLSFHQEYRFDKDRKFRFDFAICPDILKLAVEYEGIFNDGMNGHTSKKHFVKDVLKYRLAQEQGWTVIRCTAKDYATVLRTLDKIIENKNNPFQNH